MIRKLSLFLLLSFPAMAQVTVHDTFPGSGAFNSNWTNSSVGGYVPCNQFSGNAAPASSTSQCIESYTGASFTNNQYSQFVTNGTLSGNATSPGVRFDTAGNGYVFSPVFGLYKLTAGTGSVQLAACQPASNGDLLYISAVGTTITGTDITTGNSCSATDSSYTTGQPAVYLDNRAGSNNITLFQAGTFVGFTASPGALVVSSTGNSVNLAGTNTSWTAGTPGTPTFTVSGVACSITSQVVSSATAANITVSAGGTIGICTIHDPSTSTTYPISVIANPIVQTKMLDCTAGCTNATITWATATTNGDAIGLTGFADIPLPANAFQYNTKQYLLSFCPSYTPLSSPTSFGFAYAQIKTLSSTAISITEANTWHGYLVAYEIRGENLVTGATCTGTNTSVMSTITATNFGQAAGGFSIGVVYDLPSTPTITGTLTNTDVAFAHNAIFNSGYNTSGGAVTYTASYSSASANPGINLLTLTYNATQLNPLYSVILSPAGGNYAASQSVTASEPMLGAAHIRCTTDGSTPGPSSPIYTGPISVTSGTVTVSCYAQALANVVADSGVSANTYTISGNAKRTWFVRSGGGALYSAANPTNTCNGLADVDDPGSGALPRNCAVNDARWLWDNQHPGGYGWVIQGQDTVVIRGCVASATNTVGNCRIGHDQGTSGSDVWCPGGSADTCIMPPIPSGTSGAHTKILGGCAYDGTCAHNKTNYVFLHGGFSVADVIDLGNAQWVDVAGINAGSYGNCIVHGSPNPNPCSNSLPLSDFIQESVQTSQSTHDVTLTDMWIHGATDRGVKGPIGGTVTANFVNIDTNGLAGWDFDDGSVSAPCAGGQIGCYGKSSINGTWNFYNSIIQFSGCNQEWPFTHTIPVAYCYDVAYGGYGDGVGTPPGFCVNVDMENSQVLYNTQDGEDFGHCDGGNSGTGYYDQSSVSMLLKNNFAYANEGSGFKTGPQFNPQTLEGNISVANGQRLAYPITGTPQYTISSWSITGCPGAGVASFVTSTQAFNTSNQVNLAGFATTTSLNGASNQLVASSGLSSTTFQINPWNCGIQGNGSATEAGIATTLGGGLAAFNRSGGGQAWSMNVHAGSQVTMIANTLISYMETTYLESCWEGSWFCPGAAWVFTDNITFGIQDALPPSSLQYNGNSGGTGGILFNYGNDIQSFTGSNNQWYGVRNGTTGFSGDIVGSDVLFQGETAAWTCLVSGGAGCTFAEATLDTTIPPLFNSSSINLTNSSPGKAAGVLTAVTTDFFGHNFLNPPSMGAVQFGSGGVSSPTVLRGVILRGVIIP